MTHAFVVEFENQDDHDYYHLEDQVHIDFSKHAAPLIDDSVVVGNGSTLSHTTNIISRGSSMLIGIPDIEDGKLVGTKAKKPGKLPGLYQGSCHCGQLEWEAKLETAEHILCHCNTCKKLGGGPYSMNQIIHKVRLNALLWAAAF